MELCGGGETSQNQNSGNPSSVDISNILGNLTGDAPVPPVSSGASPFPTGNDAPVTTPPVLSDAVPESTLPTGIEPNSIPTDTDQVESNLGTESTTETVSGADTASAVAAATDGPVTNSASKPSSPQTQPNPTVAQTPSLENTALSEQQIATTQPPPE